MTKYLQGPRGVKIETLGALKTGASKFRDACDSIRRSIESAFVIPWEIGIYHFVSPEKKLGQLGAEHMNVGGVVTVKAKRPLRAGQVVIAEDVEP